MFSSTEIIEACEKSELNLSRYGFEHKSFVNGFQEGVMWTVKKVMEAENKKIDKPKQ